MVSGSILDLVMPIVDDAGACKLPYPVSTIAGGGMVTTHSNVCSGLIYTKACSYDSIVLQAAVTSAARGHKVLVIMGEHRWERLPPAWHQMPQPQPEIMQRVSFLYPDSVKVGFNEEDIL